jgi:hypothetical protein
MNALRKFAAATLPPPVRRTLRGFHRGLVFRRAMRRFLENPAAVAESPGGVLSELIYGWGNESWSGQQEYLQECLRHATLSEGPILECGSGLTTVLVGAVAQNAGTTVWSLEHLPGWGARVRIVLDAYRIGSVRLCVAPLKDYGGFDWYAPPLDAMPAEFPLVVCDGPPAATRGGRYGLSGVMLGRLKPGCVILLDDAARPPEQAVAKRWEAELAGVCESRGVKKPYFLMKVGARGVSAPG